MSLAEKIARYLKDLPEAKQIEVLDFVEYLYTKTHIKEDNEWQDFSLSSAMQGMENEPSPYSINDIKESFHDK